MAIPAKPLELTIDADELTLDEIEVFAGTSYSILTFKQFLVTHSNWTRAEIGAIKKKELGELHARARSEVDKAFDPLSDSPS